MEIIKYFDLTKKGLIMRIGMPKGISSVFKLYKHMTDAHKKKLFYLAVFMIFTTIFDDSPSDDKQLHN